MYKIFVSVNNLKKRCGIRKCMKAQRGAVGAVFKDIRQKLRTVEGLTHRYENEDE